MYTRPLPVQEMINFALHMSFSLKAKIPILTSLANAKDHTLHRATKSFLSRVHQDVRGGSSFAEAFSKGKGQVDPFVLSLMKTYEKRGDLSHGFDEIVLYFKWKDKLSSQIKKAISYPLFLAILITGLHALLMVFLMPELTLFLKNLDIPPQPFTEALIATSTFTADHGWLMLFGLGFFSLFIKVGCALSSAFDRATDQILRHLPGWGKITTQIMWTRFFYLFHTLIAAKIDLLTALKLAGETLKSSTLQYALNQAKGNIHAGASLAQSLKNIPRLPLSVFHILNVGESTGRLEEALAHISDFQTKALHQTLERLISLLEPLLTLVMGIMILWIILGVFYPLYTSLSLFESL